MKRNIITTADGSKTIQIEDWNEQYHSVKGALNEANHVYIKHGLLFYYKQRKLDNVTSTISQSDARPISILEIGFGTGLNAFLTLIETEKHPITVNYVGIEAYPVNTIELTALDYGALFDENYKTQFNKIHQIPWEQQTAVTTNFTLKKEHKFFKDIKNVACFDIIYFDAFGADVQPELWTEYIFELMYNALKPNAILVTYSAKGSVKRALRAVGFTVKRLIGPPGKHHMLRATKS